MYKTIQTSDSISPYNNNAVSYSCSLQSILLTCSYFVDKKYKNVTFLWENYCFIKRNYTMLFFVVLQFLYFFLPTIKSNHGGKQDERVNNAKGDCKCMRIINIRVFSFSRPKTKFKKMSSCATPLTWGLSRMAYLIYSDNAKWTLIKWTRISNFILDLNDQKN